MQPSAPLWCARLFHAREAAAAAAVCIAEPLLFSGESGSNDLRFPERRESELTMELNGSAAAHQDGPTSRSSSPDLHLHLHYGSFKNSLASLTSRTQEDEEGGVEGSASSPTCQRSYLAVAALCYINLLNYMERYIIAGSIVARHHPPTSPSPNTTYSIRSLEAVIFPGVLPKIQEFFSISDSMVALLQTGRLDPSLLLEVTRHTERGSPPPNPPPSFSNTIASSSASRVEQCRLYTERIL